MVRVYCYTYLDKVWDKWIAKAVGEDGSLPAIVLAETEADAKDRMEAPFRKELFDIAYHPDGWTLEWVTENYLPLQAALKKAEDLNG